MSVDRFAETKSEKRAASPERVRTMQFQIDQHCPAALALHPELQPPSNGFPVAVWVHYPAVKGPCLQACGSSVYYLIDLTRHPFLTASGGGHPSVCEHMGRLIE